MTLTREQPSFIRNQRPTHPSLVKEATSSLQMLKVIHVALTAKESKVGHFKVIVEKAEISTERATSVIGHKAQLALSVLPNRRQKTTLVGPLSHRGPQCGYRVEHFISGNHEPVARLIERETLERICLDVVIEATIVVQPHEVVVLERELVTKEEPTVEATHETIV